MTEFLQVEEFKKDLKKQNKKYNTLNNDLETFCKALAAELPNHLRKTVQISGLGQDVKVPIFKVRRFRCQYLGGGSNSGIRVIYAYEQNRDKVTLIEIYHKSKQENEKRERILKYFA